MKIRVYFNLTKKVYSIQQKVNGRWKVLGHTPDVTLAGVKFICYNSTRMRVLSENKKYVHAYFEGESTEFFPVGSPYRLSEVTYNPRKFPTHDGEGSYTYEDGLTEGSILGAYWDITLQEPRRECDYIKMTLSPDGKPQMQTLTR